nr:uncharacterized protein LOC125389993 isoform X2 [Myodes glareolus]XP_048274705.1 uncharacterized protein LOC125389993 isoform X2 [Myodes glareolus]
MEGFINTTPSCPGPIYFFDQLKPKVRRWKKETQKDPFLDPKAKDDVEDLVQNLEHLSHKLEPLTEPEPTDAQENTAIPVEEDKSSTLILSEPPSTHKSPLDSQFSKTYLYKTLFEEYKVIASEILYELEKTLKKYAQDGTAFPVGLLNLMTYSWQDLIEDSFKDEPPNNTPGQDGDVGGGPTSMTTFKCKEGKVNPDAKEHLQEESQLVKAEKRSQVVLNKSSEKAPFPSYTQLSRQTTPGSSIPSVIHFSLTSKICFENGWISCTKPDLLKLKADLKRAVKRLQTTTVQM